MAAKKNRNLKVYGQSGYKYKETPTIMLKGEWLRDAGFDIGRLVEVRCEEGRLIIILDEAREKIIEEERAFMEKETRRLKKRLELEERKLYEQFVAEQEARYGV